jgi:hypothetical protein
LRRQNPLRYHKAIDVGHLNVSHNESIHASAALSFDFHLVELDGRRPAADTG